MVVCFSKNKKTEKPDQWVSLHLLAVLNHNILVKYIFLRSSVICNVHKLNSNIVRPGIICIS
ncbi:hypothetical protein DW733_13150, partial [Ruminococcus sp. AM28-13]